MPELHVQIKISFSMVDIDTLQTQCEHESSIETCGKKAWTNLIMMTFIEIDVLLVEGFDEGGGKYTRKQKYQANGH